MRISSNEIVFLNGQSSEWGNIKAGVPQGSALGPLFRIFQIVFWCGCFDRSGSNDISHLKVQSATFLGLRPRFLAETLTAGMVEKIKSYPNSYS